MQAPETVFFNLNNNLPDNNPLENIYEQKELQERVARLAETALAINEVKELEIQVQNLRDDVNLLKKHFVINFPMGVSNEESRIAYEHLKKIHKDRLGDFNRLQELKDTEYTESTKNIQNTQFNLEITLKKQILNQLVWIGKFVNLQDELRKFYIQNEKLRKKVANFAENQINELTVEEYNSVIDLPTNLKKIKKFKVHFKGQNKKQLDLSAQFLKFIEGMIQNQTGNESEMEKNALPLLVLKFTQNLNSTFYSFYTSKNTFLLVKTKEIQFKKAVVLLTKARQLSKDVEEMLNSQGTPPEEFKKKWENLDQKFRVLLSEKRDALEKFTRYYDRKREESKIEQERKESKDLPKTIENELALFALVNMSDSEEWVNSLLEEYIKFSNAAKSLQGDLKSFWLNIVHIFDRIAKNLDRLPEIYEDLKDVFQSNKYKTRKNKKKNKVFSNHYRNLLEQNNPDLSISLVEKILSGKTSQRASSPTQCDLLV